MNQQQWDSLQTGSIIRNIKSKRLRKVLCVKNKSIKLCKVSGRGTTVYCNGDKYLWEPTGFKIKIMDTEKFNKAREVIHQIETIEASLKDIEILLKSGSLACSIYDPHNVNKLNKEYLTYSTEMIKNILKIDEKYHKEKLSILKSAFAEL